MRSLLVTIVLFCSLSQPGACFLSPPTRRAHGGVFSLLQSTVEPLNAEEIRNKLEKQLERMKEKDKKSRAITKEELNIVHDDDHIIVVEKPAGILCISRDKEIPTLSKVVFDMVGCEMGAEDRMVVHRLGMDTSGLMIFAKTLDGVRGMNSLFRTRRIHREYEALLCGHLENDETVVTMPLMRDYEFPPFMRVSTEEHQRALIDLDPEIVGKKLLEAPKPCLTKIDVMNREELEGHAVSRVVLTSISGRTHQLNVHCAAIGHPIVGDTVYGLGGDAAPNGGLDVETLIANYPNRATEELQQQIAEAAKGMSVCVHAKTISFKHPVSREQLSLTSKVPF